MNFDDNALYRQPAVVELRDLAEEDSKEIKAKEYGLSYIALDGSIGCLVNGAGLAMATMDIIKHAGGAPANCDVIAQGVIEAAKSIGITVPVVVRLQGTNVELGKKLLAESGLELVTADDLGEAAQKVVGLVG